MCSLSHLYSAWCGTGETNIPSFPARIQPGEELKSGAAKQQCPILQVDDAAFEKNEALFEKLLGLDDVDAVHTNCAGLA